jgi:hypothetical protein
MGWCCMEGFDGLGAIADVAYRSWRAGGAGLKFTSSGGRRGSAGLYDDTSGSTTERYHEYGGNFFRTFPSLATVGPNNDFEFGFAFKITGTGWDSKSSGYTIPLASLRSSSAEILRIELQLTGSTWQLAFKYAAVTRLSGSFPGGGGSGTRPTSDQWYYVTLLLSGWEASGSNAKSQYLLVDGTSISSLLNNTVANANVSSDIAYIRMGSGNGVSGDITSGDAVYWDDIVLCTSLGESPSTFVSSSSLAASTYMGPVRVDRVVGSTENTNYDDEFVASSGGGNDEYPMVDDTGGHDGDSTYVYSSTIGHTAQGGMTAGEPLPHTPTIIWGAKAMAIVKNAGDGIAVVRCDLAHLNTRDAGGSATYSLPAGGSYEGMHSLKVPGVSSTDGDFHGSYNASTSRWVLGGSTGGIRYATALLEYVS